MRAFHFLLTLIILSAGCISGLPFSIGGGSGSGVSISTMSFSSSNIKSNQLARLSVSIANSGDYDIESDEGYVYVFGLPNDWEISDKSGMSTFADTFSLYGVQNRGGKIYPGETKNFDWVLRAPQNLPKDEVFTYPAQARVCYPYKTKIWGTLEVVSENEWLRSPPKEHTIAVQQTKGPIKIDFLSTQPLMVESDVRIKVRVTNTGDGVVTANPCSLFAKGAGDDELAAIENLNKISLGDSDCTLTDDIYLQKGQSKETYITCSPPSLGDEPIKTDDFTMELTYNYYSDRKASISVTGTSEAAAGGIVGDGAGTITLTDLCTKSCAAAKQTFSGSEARGMCRPEKESPAYDYPPGNTFGFQLWLERLNINEQDSKPKSIYGTVALSTIYGSTLSTLTIKDLKLHDARLGDFSSLDSATNDNGIVTANGLLDLKIKDLDSATFSKQYDQKMLDADTDGDGLPDYFEEAYSTKIISADSKDANKNGVKDPDEKPSNGETYMSIYKGGSSPERTLGIAKYLCDNYPTGRYAGVGVKTGGAKCIDDISNLQLIKLESISFNNKEYKPGNNADAEALKNLPIESLKITAIDGIAISDIAKSNPSRKVRSTISDISIADIFVNSALKVADKNVQNFMKYSKCSSKNAPASYSRDTVCKCITQTGGNKIDKWQPASADNTQCRLTCKNTANMDSGECASKTYTKGPICKNSKVVEIRSFNNVDLGCGSSPNSCVCFGKTLGTISAQDVPIVCGEEIKPKAKSAPATGGAETKPETENPVTAVPTGGAQSGSTVQQKTSSTETQKVTEEKVTCIFEGSAAKQECYSDDGNFICSGIRSCTVSHVWGGKGEKIAWKSDCTGDAVQTTTVDGINEEKTFNCVQAPVKTSTTPLESVKVSGCIAEKRHFFGYGGCGSGEEECTKNECGVIAPDMICCAPSEIVNALYKDYLDPNNPLNKQESGKKEEVVKETPIPKQTAKGTPIQTPAVNLPIINNNECVPKSCGVLGGYFCGLFGGCNSNEIACTSAECVPPEGKVCCKPKPPKAAVISGDQGETYYKWVVPLDIKSKPNNVYEIQILGTSDTHQLKVTNIIICDHGPPASKYSIENKCALGTINNEPPTQQEKSTGLYCESPNVLVSRKQDGGAIVLDSDANDWKFAYLHRSGSEMSSPFGTPDILSLKYSERTNTLQIGELNRLKPCN